MSNRIEDLVPEMQPKIRNLLARAALENLQIKVTHTLRTLDEQAHLYAKGRTLPGEPCNHGGRLRAVGTCTQHPLGAIVTNAKPGFSWHNFGRAADVAFMGKEPYPRDERLWRRLGEIGKSLGLEWREQDKPHFQDRGGTTLLAAREQAGLA